MLGLSDFLCGCHTGEYRADIAQSVALYQTRRHNPRLAAVREWLAAPVPVKQGPLSGVSVSAKDNIGVSGMQTWAGSSAALPQKWQQSGSFIRRLQSLGAVVTSKSHCAEFALGGSGYNPNQGTPCNPWSQMTPLAPGGSSSGTAVAVASGMAMLGVGTDTGGSVRVPAALCGCVGYRSSPGHWAMDGIVPLASQIDALGLITRSVTDMACTVAAIEACETLKAAPLLGTRIALWPADRLADCDSERRAAMQRAGNALAAAGATLSEARRIEIDSAVNLLEQGPNTAGVELARYMASELPAWRSTLNPQVESLISEYENVCDDALERRVSELKLLSERREHLFDGADLVLSPTTALPPPPIEQLSCADGYALYSNALLRFTVIGSLYGCCGISIPAGLDSNGLPLSVQLLARPGDDLKLLSAALALELLLPPTPTVAELLAYRDTAHNSL